MWDSRPQTHRTHRTEHNRCSLMKPDWCDVRFELTLWSVERCTRHAIGEIKAHICFGSLRDIFHHIYIYIIICMSLIYTLHIFEQYVYTHTYFFFLLSFSGWFLSGRCGSRSFCCISIWHNAMLTMDFVSSPTQRRNYLPALCADAAHHSERSRLPEIAGCVLLQFFSEISFVDGVETFWVSNTVQMKVWPQRRQHDNTRTENTTETFSHSGTLAWWKGCQVPWLQLHVLAPALRNVLQLGLAPRFLQFSIPRFFWQSEEKLKDMKDMWRKYWKFGSYGKFNSCDQCIVCIHTIKCIYQCNFPMCYVLLWNRVQTPSICKGLGSEAWHLRSHSGRAFQDEDLRASWNVERELDELDPWSCCTLFYIFSTSILDFVS